MDKKIMVRQFSFCPVCRGMPRGCSHCLHSHAKGVRIPPGVVSKLVPLLSLSVSTYHDYGYGKDGRPLSKDQKQIFQEKHLKRKGVRI